MPKLSRCLILAALAFPFATQTQWAQGPAVVSTPAPYELEWSSPGAPEIRQIQEVQSVVTDRGHRSSHWKEGLATGAVVGALVGGLGLYAFCDGMRDNPDESCGFKAPLGGAIGALVGGGVGALIGGLFPKQATEGDPVP